MDCHYGYQQCPGRDRLRPFGAVFFAMGVFQSAASFREIQRPEFALRHFIRFAGAKVAVGYSLEIMLAIFPHLRRRRFQCHVRHGRSGIHRRHPANGNRERH